MAYRLHIWHQNLCTGRDEINEVTTPGRKMESSYDSVKQLVSENSVDEFMTASSVLITFANNILENPNEKKYRRIRIVNPVVESKLLNVAGGMECLFDMGFEEIEDGEILMLPPTANLQIVKNIKDDLNKEREKLQSQQGVQVQTPRQNGRKEGIKHQNQVHHVRSSHSYLESEAAFLSRLQEGLRRVMQYESSSAQQKARDIMPVHQLRSEAKKKHESSVATGQKIDFKDCLLLVLLAWFKQSFFHWVDTLPCSRCNGATKNTGSANPTVDDLRWGASRVEAHTCNSCSHISRFPRYTNPEKLLESKRGRCGEWADCFTLCCRALDFEARYVMDWTDHVWTEVYSESQSRWLHCDPCENICDKPLLYESGWGKKLSYVIAVSKDEIQDVTWRYSTKHNDVLARRTLCRETWLRHTIHRLWCQKISTLPSEQQQQLWKRLIHELVEFVTVKNGSTESLPGRSTGSLAWRQARGELGQASAQTVVQKKYVFRPSEPERESEVIHVQYSCALDKYIRKSSGDEVHLGWQACVFSAQDLFRKEEFDWKTVYLARQEGSDYSEVSWKFDLADTDLRISKMELKAETAVYENGSINWRICAGDNCFSQIGASLQEFITFDLRGCKTLTVTAVLQGGKGDVAWQHTQLFRQSAEDNNHYPFEIKLFLN